MKAAYGLIFLIFGHVCYGDDSGSDRIVGGEPAKKGEFPWFVKIFAINLGLCAGTILDNRTILTTASCGESMVKRFVKSNEVKIIVGDHLYWKKDEYEQTVVVKRVIMHPQYDRITREYIDVAILKLRCELQFNDYIQAVPIVSNPWKEKRLIDINNCAMAGFGSYTFPALSRPWQLQKAEVSVKDRWYCAWKMRDQMPWATFNKYMICTDEPGVSACVADRGAGLVCKDGNDDPYLIGIMSYYTGDCSNSLNVFTRVLEFADWIEQYLHI